MPSWGGIFEQRPEWTSEHDSEHECKGPEAGACWCA